MKRLKFTLLLMVFTMIADTPLSIAAISKGSLCSASKVNQVVKSGKYFYICKQVGAKNKWALSTNKAYLAFKIKTDEELAKLNAEFESQKNAQNEIDAENTQAEKDANNAQAKRDAEIAQEKNDSLSKGTSYNCLIGKYCSIGNIGPGGGIVFYGEGIAGSGKFLEVVIDGKGEFSLPYCFPRPGIKTFQGYEFNGINDYIMQYPDKPGYVFIDTRIGDGSRNTKLIAEKCQTSAANKVLEFRGGGLSDWFLPSAEELEYVWRIRGSLKDVSKDYYWSSSEYDFTKAKGIKFDNSGDLANLTKGASYKFRPIRKF